MITGVFDRSGHNGCAFFEKGAFFRRSVGMNIYPAFAEL